MSLDSKEFLKVGIPSEMLFAAEGADIAASEKVLNQIERYASQLERAFTGDSYLRKLFFVRYPIAEHVLPIPFLRSFLKAEKARREYRDDPSAPRSRTLTSAWGSAVREYRRSVERYRRMHDVLFSLEKDANYTLQDLFGNISGMTYVRGSIESLGQNADALERIVGGKMQIREGRETPLPLHPCVVPQKYKRLHMLEKTEGTMPFRKSRIQEEWGPYECTLRHIEGVSKPHACKLYLLHDETADLSSMWVAILDTFLFTKVWESAAKSDGTSGKTPYVFSGGLTSADTPYWYEPAGHLYVTRDPSYWMDVATYADIERRPHLDRRALAVQKSSLLERMLGACADDLRTYVTHSQRRLRLGTQSSYSFLYGILMRSHPVLYFLTFNKSVWQLEDEPDFLGEARAEMKDSPYVSQDFVVEHSSDEDLKKIFSAQKVREERERLLGYFT